MRVYQFRHVGAVLLTALYCLLDVAVELRYDIRLCRFALDQLSFAFCRAATDSHRFVSGCAVFEESESIADQLQMSKGHEKIVFRRDLVATIGQGPRHASDAKLGESLRPPLHYA
jgi:hypothetical protein